MTSKASRPASGGVLFQDPDVEHYAAEAEAEAEAGFDVDRLLKRGVRPAIGSGPAVVVPVRIDPELRPH